MLPTKRERVSINIAKRPGREFPRHRRFVRSRRCCVKECTHQEYPERSPIVFAHVRTGTDGGAGLKPSDWHGISLCQCHHDEQHNIGELAFEKKYGIDMKALAQEFARKSPDRKMIEAMREQGSLSRQGATA